VATVVERISRFTTFVSGYGFVIITLLFLLLEWPTTAGIIGRRIPDASRRQYAILITRMINLGQRYLVGSLLIVLFYWVVTAILFFVSGVPYPIVLGLVVAIPNFIPQGGGLVSAILVFVITLVTGSTTFVVNRLVFAFIQMTIFMLISGIAYYFVDVRIYSKSVRVPVWIILVGIIAFAASFGVIGAFIAAAAVAIIGELLDFTLKKLRGEDPYPGEPEPPIFLPFLDTNGETPVAAAVAPEAAED
jgi:predicted PurR-regulated permease PerM